MSTHKVHYVYHCAYAQAGLRLCYSQTPKTGFLAMWPIYSICHQFRNILFNNSLARILIRCPSVNEHETFFFGEVNMNLCFFVSASKKVTWLGVSGLTLNLISCACKGYMATWEHRKL